MQKKRLLFVLLLALLAPWAAMAQTVTIGTGTSAHSSAPIANYYNYSLCEMLFTSTEIGTTNANTILSLGFEGAAASSKTYSITIYMKNVDAESFSASSDYIKVSANDVVYTGSIKPATGWNTIELDTPFAYDNTKSLLVVVNKTSGGYDGYTSIWNYTSTSSTYKMLYNQTDGSSYDPTSLTSLATNYERPNVQLAFGTPATCPKPTMNPAQNITEEGASLSWTETGSATDWVLQYSTDAEFTNAISVNRSGIPNLAITGLNSLTTYYARVKSDCGSGDQSQWSNEISFTTTAVAVAVGDAWSDDFEGNSCGWELINGTLTNANWAWGTAVNNGGTHAIYISNDGGTSNAYNNSGYAVVFATKLLTFADSKYTFSYDWKCDGESSYDNLRVGLVPASVELVALNTSTNTLPTGWVTLYDGSYLSEQTTWQAVEKTVQVSAGNYYLVLRWRQDSSGGDNPPAAVDNVSITRVACPYDVTDLAVSNITTTTAEITWTAGEAEEWQVATKAGNGEWTILSNTYTTNNATLTGLITATNYQVRVRAYCNANDQGEWCGPISFATECDAITSFPWTENFENYAAGNFNHPCWVNEHISGNGTYIFSVYTSTTGTNSTHQLQLPDQSDGTLTKLRLPEMTLPGNDYQFTIDVYRSSNYSNKTGEGIRVYVSTDGEIEGATELAFIPRYYEVASGVIPAETTGNKWYTYSLPIGISGTCYIILRGENQYGASTYMDNFFVEQIPTCPKPQSLAVTNNSVTAHGATVTWTEAGEATQWIVEFATDADFTDVLNETVNDEPTYTFYGLDPETTYYVRVKAHCGEGNESQYSNTVNFTTGAACVVPTGLTVTNLTATSATLSWTESGEATSWQICLNNDEENLINANTNPYTLEGLTAETAYTAKVRGICNDEPTGWSSSVSFEPTAKLVIGSGTSTTGYLPTNTNYDFSYTQQIYTVAELGEAGVIESIDFYMTTTDYTRNLDIYMVNTDKESFANNTDWIAVTNADLVFSGNVNFTADSWTTITLDEGFIYNGTQNVAIIVDDNTEEWSSRNFRSFTVESNQAHYCYQDDTNIDPSAPSANTNSVTTSKNQIRILKTELSNCMKPTQFAATEVGPDFAVLSWTENGASEAWVIDYNGTTVNVTENPYTLEGLANVTPYTVKVRPTCDENLWSSEISFTTLEGCPTPENVQVSNITHNAATVAWTGYSDSYNVKYRIAPTASSEVLLEEGFESEETFANWTAISNNEANTTNGRYGRLSSAANTGDYGFAFSSFTSASDYNQYLISPELDNPGKIEFYYRHYNNVEQFKVGYSTTTNDLSAFTWGDVVSSTINWQLFEQGLNANVKYIAINYCSNYQYELYVDDIVIYASLPGGEWQTVTSNTNSYALSNLTSGATYEVQVQGVCGDQTSEWSDVVSFTTPFGMTKEITAYSTEEGVNDGWYFIASPVTENVTPSANNGFLTSEYDLYYFDQNGDSEGMEWINHEVGDGFNIENGKGYLYASSTNTTLVFSGTPYNDNGQVALTYSTTNPDEDMRGWNLVGNPFAETAYINMPFYTLDGGSEYDENAAGDEIAPMQGVLVHTDAATTLTFSTTKPNNTGKRLTLNLTQGRSIMDRAIVSFSESKPLPKKQLRANSTKVYFPIDGKDYAVVSAQNQGEMPFSFKAENNGTYTLSFNAEDVTFGYLHLIDNMTGNDVDLLSTPSYTFEAKTTDYYSRFKLVFATGTADDTFVFFSNGSFVINNEGNATLQVIDVNGRIIRSESINGCANVNVNAASGVYMLRLINGDNVKTQKVVVR